MARRGLRGGVLRYCRTKISSGPGTWVLMQTVTFNNASPRKDMKSVMAGVLNMRPVCGPNAAREPCLFGPKNAFKYTISI